MNRTAGLGFIFITLLIDILGFGLLIPILPKFIATLSHQNINAASRSYGLLLSLYGAMQFLFSPLLGTLSDRFGRRPILLLSLLFTGFDYVIMALAPTLAWLYVGRILSGVTGASFTAASAYIADVSPPEKRAQNFGIIGAAFGIGFIIGPAAGGLLGQMGTRIPFWAAAVLAFANLLYGWFILPESLQSENRRHFVLRDANPLQALKILGKYPIVWGLSGAVAASSLGGQCLQSTWVLYTADRFGWTVRDNGLSLAAWGVVSIVFQLGIARVWLPRIDERLMVLLGLSVGVVEFVAYGVATQGWMTYVIMIAAGVRFLSSQATQGILSRQVGADEQGALQGALASIMSMAAIIGPILATFLFAYFTRPHAAVKVPGVAFFLGAGLYAIALIVSARVLSRPPTQRVAATSSA